MDKLNDIISAVEKLTVPELAELVKAIEEKFGVSSAMAVSAGGAGGGTSAAEEKTSFNILLKSAGSQKIQVIKVLKEALGIGLAEAKALADAAPKVVKEGLAREAADELKKKLADAGAEAELQ